MKKFLSLLFVLVSATLSAQTIYSPDKKIKLLVSVTDRISYQVSYENNELTAPSIIDMILENGMQLSKSKGVRKVSKASNRSVIVPPVPEKRKNIPDIYNELKLDLKSPFTITFRVYDDGVAYRISTSIKDSIVVKTEIAEFHFPPSLLLYSEVQGGRTDRFHTSFEETYATKQIDSLTEKNLLFNPAVVMSSTGPKIAINESDVDDYPGMFLSGSS